MEPNEQDPRPMLLPGSLSKGTHRGPLLIKQRKGRSTAGLYALNLLGYTELVILASLGPNAAYNDRYNEM
jgi:hypothetical protein